jgi:hypothetical protein
MPFQRGRARRVRFPLDIEPRGLEDLDDGAADFRADAVAGDQRDAMLSHSACAIRRAALVTPSLPNRAARARQPC